MRQLEPKWQTDIGVRGPTGKTRVPVSFKQGLFQRDLLSPLLFVLAISPISVLLREIEGYLSPNLGKITHLFYMDDLKLYGGGKNELDSTVKSTEYAAQAVGMELGAPKCGVAHIRHG